MDHNSRPNHVEPVEVVVPEEDPHLLAIEALEARSVDDLAKPSHASGSQPVPPREPAVAMPTLTPKIKEPIGVRPIAPTLKPVEIKHPLAPVTPQKPKKPATTAEAIAEELTHASTSRAFQFFTNHPAPRKPFIVIGGIIVVTALGIGVYFFLR
ncbi:MAG: hypothetical protein EOT05_03160 [Candidatus Microsaccharimonas sossegonensis]|uniref:Uncharacterized protein n=1 Tax=Candidatus Microsaccharimonas sossegonensis TaxID=2506948 RepID=A0A4Q0AHR3_9BACT|nr:MAG: hypothetical protein EOT05_03160 [Candidatus Microsaccharimonas sossegonensis]